MKTLTVVSFHKHGLVELGLIILIMSIIVTSISLRLITTTTITSGTLNIDTIVVISGLLLLFWELVKLSRSGSSELAPGNRCNHSASPRAGQERLRLRRHAEDHSAAGLLESKGYSA